MNFSEIKAFLGGKPPLNPNDSVQSQLRDAGLKQATEGVRTNNESSISQLSSKTSVSLSIFSSSLNQTLQIDDKRANLAASKPSSESLFDFEEIAKNVLRFVGGVISGAAKSGADEETLTSLFEQARSGVAKGIKLAEKDLAGFLNPEISEGISRSADLIEVGIQRLQDEIFGKNDQTSEQSTENTRVNRTFESVAFDQQQSASLNITTKDGDQVSILFSSAQSVSFNQQVTPEQRQKNEADTDIESNDVLPPAAEQTDELPPINLVASTNPTQAPTEDSANDSQGAELPQTNSITINQQATLYEERNFSFSVNGELDEAELESIGQLVSDAKDLANTFFNGDVKAAFNQAVELGFDDQEITSFALQLSRQEKVEVVKAYESVSHYDGSREPEEISSKPVERVSDYLQKMLNVLEQSQQKLADGEQYENLINGLVNRIQDVGTTDLVSAINDFHAFNKRLIDNLPSQKQEG